MSQSQAELSLKQKEVLRKIGLEYDSDLFKIFRGRKTLHLSKQGFKLIKDNYPFKPLRLNENLSIGEINKIKSLCDDIFYYHQPTRDLFVTDKTFVSLFNICAGDKNMIFSM